MPLAAHLCFGRINEVRHSQVVILAGCPREHTEGEFWVSSLQQWQQAKGHEQACCSRLQRSMQILSASGAPSLVNSRIQKEIFCPPVDFGSDCALTFRDDVRAMDAVHEASSYM